jgi:hypothetical protein
MERDFVIYSKDLDSYKKDSERNLKGYKRRKGKWINTMFNTITLTTPFLAVGLLASHGIYA